MGRGKKFLSLFLAAAMAVTGISVGTPVTAEAAAETKAAQEATVDLALEQFEGSGDQMQYNANDKGKVVVSAMNEESTAGTEAGTAHNAAFVRGEESAEGTTFAPNSANEGPSYFGSGGRVAAVRFKIANDLTEDKIGEAVLKITFSEVSAIGNGKIRLGVYETAVQEFAPSGDANATCTEGVKAFPAVNNDYTYAATMWSNFLQQKGYNQDGSSDQIAEVDVTRALKNAVRKGQSSVVLRLQIPRGGGRMHGLMTTGAEQIPAKAPTLTVTKTAPVTVKYMAVSGDDAIGAIKTEKKVNVTIGKEYAYEVPDSEKIVTASDGTGIVTYEYLSSDPASLTVTADDGTGTANVITLKYKQKLADKTALQAKINQVKVNKEANYTPETWAPFKAALDEAEAVMADKYATDAQVQAALDKLTAADDALELSEEGKKQPATAEDKAALTSYITGIETKYTSDAEYTVAYSKAARDAFAAAVAEAKGKVSTVNTLQDIETVKAALRTAEATLNAAFVTPYDGKAADIQALDEKITEAGGLLTEENKAKNEEAYNTLKTAKETAEAAKNTALTTEVTKDDVTGATSTLNTAIETFKEAIKTPVTPPGEDDDEITGVTLNHTTLEVAENGTATLTATIEPANAKDKTLEWTVDKTDVVKVEAEGETRATATVTGLKEGTAKITVSTKNNMTATCDVTVTAAGTGEDDVEITGVKLDKTTLSLKEKDTAKLTATVEPANATTDKTLTWTSDKEDVAKVGQDGTVTGVKAGTAKITVSTKNGKTAACTVTVTSAGTGTGTGTGTTEVKVSLDKTAVTLAAGKDVTLKATVNPANAGSVSWTSSDDKVATVANGKVTAKKAGTAKITAAVGTKSAVCTVTVVSLSKTKATLGVKEKLTLKVNGTTKKVTWKTSNKKVATVTNGKVTAKKANKKAINITATVDGVTLTCKVTVKAAPKKLILKGKKTVTVKKNKTVKLKVSLPKNTAGTLKYKSSNKKVAKVDAKGKVKGVKKGTAKITVTAANNKKAKVVVTVKVK